MDTTSAEPLVAMETLKVFAVLRTFSCNLAGNTLLEQISFKVDGPRILTPETSLTPSLTHTHARTHTYAHAHTHVWNSHPVKIQVKLAPIMKMLAQILVLFRMSNLINKEGPKWSGHVEHVEQLERRLCQHCLSQMPEGGEQTFRIVNDVMDGGW